MRMLDLFAGIGGASLAAEWAGIETVAFCEIDPYCQKVLNKNFPDIPIHDNIKTLNKETFERMGVGDESVDIISGGFPCQPFSVAGKRKGKDDDRYLWPEMLRVIQEFKPAWVVGENVAGIVNMALDQVLFDLEAQGYETQSFLIPACGVDAPHRRNRVFIVAHSLGERWGRRGDGNENGRNRSLQIERPGPAEECGILADTNGDGTRRYQSANWQRRRSEQNCKNVANAPCEQSSMQYEQKSSDERKREFGRSGSDGDVFPDADSEGLQGGEDTGSTGSVRTEQNKQFTGCDWLRQGWSVEPDVGRVANGIPSRVDRLKCLGNAVVPQQIYPIFKYIVEIERNMKWI